MLVKDLMNIKVLLVTRKGIPSLYRTLPTKFDEFLKSREIYSNEIQILEPRHDHQYPAWDLGRPYVIFKTGLFPEKGYSLHNQTHALYCDIRKFFEKQDTPVMEFCIQKSYEVCGE